MIPKKIISQHTNAAEKNNLVFDISLFAIFTTRFSFSDVDVDT